MRVTAPEVTLTVAPMAARLAVSPVTCTCNQWPLLALGSALGTVAVLLKKEFLLAIIGGVFISEVISVIIQTTYFKFTRKRYGEGRRIFKMAPLHHHFELQGWHESKVVVRFWIIGILMALLSLTTFKTQ